MIYYNTTIKLKVAENEKNIIKLAAEAENKSVSRFVRDAALKQAKK